MKHLLLGLVLAVIGQSATAEVVYCRFEKGFQPSTFVKWNTVRNTMSVEFGWPRQRSFYTDVAVYPVPLGPYQGKSKALSVIIFGDVPALHLRKTGNGRIMSDSDRSYPYEAYLGNIPGRLAGGWLGGQFGARGACWTKRLPGTVRDRSDKNGNHSHGRDCDHNGGGKSSERSSNR